MPFLPPNQQRQSTEGTLYTLQSAVPLERNPIGTKAQQNENMCPIRSKEAFVLTGRPRGTVDLEQSAVGLPISYDTIRYEMLF